MTVADRVSYDAGFNLGGFSVSDVGRLAYRASQSERRQLTWFDRTGKALGVAGEPDANELLTPALSPDGRHIAVTRNCTRQPGYLGDRRAARWSDTPHVRSQPSMVLGSGRRMVCASLSSRTARAISDLFLKPSSGAGCRRTGIGVAVYQDSPLTGRSMADSCCISTVIPKNGWDLVALPMTGDRKPIVVVSTPFEERGGQFSPDGRWMAYQSNESGRFEIYVQPFPGPGGKWQGVNGRRHTPALAGGWQGVVLPRARRDADGGGRSCLGLDVRSGFADGALSDAAGRGRHRRPQTPICGLA